MKRWRSRVQQRRLSASQQRSHTAAFCCGSLWASSAQALQAGVKVLDLSADFRLNSAEAYQEWYKTAHPYPEMLPVPYGLPEINRAQIGGIDMVGVPGCYPTATLLGLYPLLSAHALAGGAPIIVDAKSGVSGAGRQPKPTTHFVEVFGNLSPYNVGRVHRHTGEIEATLGRARKQGRQGLVQTPARDPQAQTLGHVRVGHKFANRPKNRLLPPNTVGRE